MHLCPSTDVDVAALADLKHGSVRSWIQILILRVINAFGNFPKPWDPALTTEHLLDSPVRVALSVL
jgi:hypothetical protein